MKLISILFSIILLIFNEKMFAMSEDMEEGVKTSKLLLGSKEEFRILLKEKRKEQISAVKTLQSMAKY